MHCKPEREHAHAHYGPCVIVRKVEKPAARRPISRTADSEYAMSARACNKAMGRKHHGDALSAQAEPKLRAGK